MSKEVIRQEHACTRQGVFPKEGMRSVTIVLQPFWAELAFQSEFLWPELKAGPTEVQYTYCRDGVSSSIVAFSYMKKPLVGQHPLPLQ